MGGWTKGTALCALGWMLGIIVLLASAPADATRFETVLMPGKLSQAHADIEAECDLCHERFRKRGQAEKCLACHDHADIAADINKQEGFHGRLKQRGVVLCESCHTEHKGREADIVGLSPLSFDHSATDFALRNRHLGRECAACHKKGDKFRAAPDDCFACHKANDAHQGKLGKQCEDCHSDKGWRVTHFDHDKTKFKLVGKHHDTACLLCHTGHRYKDTPKVCIDCHRLNDVHNRNYGKKCGDCHVPKGWREIEFDHDKQTKFPLRGVHKTARCSACHTGDLYKDKLKSQCIACHRNDDWHKGRNGEKCESCHNERSWRESRFDHNKQTKFKLDGKHAKLACVACHKGSPEKEKDKRACNACHAINDVHKGGAGKVCSDCHSTREWKKTSFDHGRDTEFRLRGAHGKLVCNQCHVIAPKEQKLATACYDCHRRDDVHKGQQGHTCQKCHAEESWIAQVKFEHDLSAFPLIGQHALVSCEACHTTSAFKDAPLECVQCHRSSDEHHGTLGEQCALCHNPNAWTAWIFDHDTQTDFKLQGAHKKLTCARCHTSAVREIKQSTSCPACHRNDDIHLGAFGARCDRCHGLDSFQQLNIKR